MKTYKTFEEAFVNTIKHVITSPTSICSSRNGSMYETLGYGFKVLDASSYKFENEKLGRIDYEYAENFYQWMMGEISNSDFIELYPNQTKGFLDKPKSKNLPENFNTLYGPRIQRQLPIILNELMIETNSRRAVISILSEDDLKLLTVNDDPNLEFPCADSCAFNIRNGKLYMHLHMRSNNMGNVAKIDMYLWGKLMDYVSEKLTLLKGDVTYTIVSAHVFENDFKYFSESKILEQMYGTSLEEMQLTIKTISIITKNALSKLGSHHKIYGIRHAKTINNVDRIYQGGDLTNNEDILLDDHFYSTLEGLKNSTALFRKISHIYTSTALRTQSTFDEIYNNIMLEKDVENPYLKHMILSKTELLNEFNLGSKDGMPMDSSVANLTSLVLYLDKALVKGYAKYDIHGESIIELFNRVCLFIQTLSKELNDDKKHAEVNTLIIGHGTWFSALQLLLGKGSSFVNSKVNNLFLFPIK